MLCELRAGLNTLEKQKSSCRRTEAQQRMLGCSAHSPVTVPTVQPKAQSLYRLRWAAAHTARCVPLTTDPPVSFPKLPDFRRSFAKRFTDDKNPRNFGWQYCSEHFGWDTYRNLWYVWFKYSRGSKQNSLLRRRRQKWSHHMEPTLKYQIPANVWHFDTSVHLKLLIRIFTLLIK